MAKGIQCIGNQNEITLESLASPEDFIIIFFLINIFALGSYVMIRIYLKMKQIRVEMPVALHDIFQAPTNDQFGIKPVLLYKQEEFSVRMCIVPTVIILK